MRESDLCDPARTFLESRGYAVLDEVRIGGRRADLVGIGDAVAAVELKLRDWGGALRQAMAYQLGADFAWVAMPLDSAARALRFRDRFEREGVGLLGVVHGECRELVPARPSPRLLPPLGDTARSEWSFARLLRSFDLGAEADAEALEPESAAPVFPS